MNSKLHAVCNGDGKPLALTLTEGQVSDYKGAAILLGALPEAKELLANRGYDATWFRIALLNRGITLCIPSKKNRKQPVSYDKNLYKQKHKTEIMFGRLKDWHRIAMLTTGAPTLSFRHYALPVPLSFISINES